MSHYRVLFVDDEKDIINIIEKKIDWEALNLAKPAYAANGLEALEMAESLHPDIVVTDIKMPYMDGLSLAKALRSQDPSVRILFLSGFDEFEYAQAAIDLNADQYLLKPINASQLATIFAKIVKKLDDEKSERNNQAKLQAYYEQSLPILQDNILASIAQTRMPTNRIEQTLQDYQLHLPGPHYVVCVIHTSKNHLAKQTPYPLACLSVRQLATEKIDAIWKPQFFNLFDDLAFIANLAYEQELAILTDQLDGFCRQANSLLSVVVTCGIGLAVNRLSNLPASTETALQAVNYRVLYGSSRAISITDLGQTQPSNETNDTDLRKVLSLIKLEDQDQLEKAIIDFLSANSHHQTLMEHDLFLMDMMTQIVRFAKGNNLHIESLVGDYASLQNKDPLAVEIWLKDLALAMQVKLQESRRTSTQAMVDKAKEYVHANYQDADLSLPILCKQLGVSECYFSTIFKKETGESFVRYLTQVRIDKACSLLLETDEKAYTIASQVGFNDPNYFSYVFRRTMGQSPSKYKANRQ